MIQLKKVEKWFGDARAIKGIDLFIDDGEFVVFVGPSGCGKSTVLRMIAGLEETSRGDIFINGDNVTDQPPVKRGLALVFQSYALYPHMSVRQNMGFGLKITGMDASQIAERVHQVADILQLTEYLDRRPKQLSGGQRQRVAMGRAIVREPTAFLFDEPLSNLDAKLRTKMRLEIKKLHQRLKTTMIYVTHDQIEAMSLADKVVILQSGIIEQVGAPMEVFLKPKNMFVAGFMGSPSMNFVTGAVRDHTLVFANGDAVPLPQAVIKQCTQGQQVTMGLRPENMCMAKPQSDKVQSLTITPTVYEPLGSEGLISFTYNNSDWVAKIFSTAPVATGDAITLYYTLDTVHFFDATMQNRLGD